MYFYIWDDFIFREDFMKKIYIYEGPMSCLTGVCGLSPDEDLMRLKDLI